MAKITKGEGPTNAADPDATPETVDRTYAPMTDDDYAERAYGAYADAHGWQDYASGEPLGNWEDADDAEQAAWRAVVRQLRGDLLEPGGRQPAKRAPERDDADAANVDDGAPVGKGPLLDDNGAEYPEGGNAGDVEGWVSGNSDRARYALDREALREGGPRAGLSASLRKLVPAESDG